MIPSVVEEPTGNTLDLPSDLIRREENPSSPRADKKFATIVMLVITASGMLLFLFACSFFSLMTIISLVTKASLQDTSAMFNTSWTTGTLFILNLPAALYAISRLLGKNIRTNPFEHHYHFFVLSVLLLPFLWILGSILANNHSPLIFLLAPINLLVVGIPLLALFELGTNGLTSGSPQRSWSGLSFSLIVVPFLSMTIEFIGLLVVMAVVMTIMFQNNPDGLILLKNLQGSLSAHEPDLKAIEEVLNSYIHPPVILGITFAIISLFVPLVEEILKPLAVWFLIRHKLTPAQGFVVGVICGLAFSLVESLNNIAFVSGTTWAIAAIGRIGTGLMHITTAGMTGWALASAFTEHRYGRLLLSFLLSLSLHGLWNGLSILPLAYTFLDVEFLRSLGLVAIPSLVVMIVCMLLILLGWNHRLKQQISS